MDEAAVGAGRAALEHRIASLTLALERTKSADVRSVLQHALDEAERELRESPDRRTKPPRQGD